MKLTGSATELPFKVMHQYKSTVWSGVRGEYITPKSSKFVAWQFLHILTRPNLSTSTLLRPSAQSARSVKVEDICTLPIGDRSSGHTRAGLIRHYIKSGVICLPVTVTVNAMSYYFTGHGKPVNNTNYVLQQYIPERRQSQYNLRERSHNKTLINKTTYLNEQDFLICMIYKDCY